jgi:phosphoglycolate phosphatase-like HAD superfamily hydrolase
MTDPLERALSDPPYRHYLHRMRLVLFDIDGTLLWTDGAGRRAIHRALLAEAGTAGPIDTYRFDGKTDPQIVRELLTLAGHPDATAPGLIAAVCGSYVEALRDELDQAPDGTRLMPGVAVLLSALQAHERAGQAMVGLLTGNVKAGADLKLRAAGVEPVRFAVGAYGSDSGRRAELPPIAAQRAADLTGTPFEGADLVIIGDTPDDVACGRPMGARSVAVATGYYNTTALRAAGAMHVFESLADTAAVLDALFS